MIAASGPRPDLTASLERVERQREASLAAVLAAGAELVAQRAFDRLLDAVDSQAAPRERDGATDRRRTTDGDGVDRDRRPGRSLAGRRAGGDPVRHRSVEHASRRERTEERLRDRAPGEGKRIAVADRRTAEPDHGSRPATAARPADRTAVAGERIVLTRPGPVRMQTSGHDRGGHPYTAGKPVGSAPEGIPGFTAAGSGGTAPSAAPGGVAVAAAASPAAGAAAAGTMSTAAAGGGQAGAGQVVPGGGIVQEAADVVPSRESGGAARRGGSRDAAARLARQLSSRLATARGLRRGAGTLRLRLQPGRLGGVEISFRGRDGRLEVALRAERAETRSLLREGRQELQALLQDRTTGWERIEVRIERETDDGEPDHRGQADDDHPGSRRDDPHEQEAWT